MHLDKSKILAVVLLAMFVTPFVVPITPHSVTAAGKVVAIDLTNHVVGNSTQYRAKDIFATGYTQLYTDLKANLTAAGYTVREINGCVAANLAGADALLSGKMYDQSFNFTSQEVTDITAWFKTGSKFLWVASDSDFMEPYLGTDVSFKADQPNRVLSSIGSQLRFDWGAVADTVGRGAAGADYRVFANSTEGGVNSAGFAANITANTQRVEFHSPTLLVGFKGGSYVPFSSLTLGTTLQWLYRTTDNATALDQDAAPMKTASNGQKGQYIMAAAELIPEGTTYSKVIADTQGPLGDRNVVTPIDRGVDFQGMTFALNALSWGTTAENIPSTGLDTTTLILIVVVIAVVAGAAYFFMRRKPTPK
jgi:LPXTG-motif cell wall-anchored protein